MATLERKHPEALHWWQRMFGPPSGHRDFGSRNEWMPWWWGIGITPEPMAGPFWMPPPRRPHRHRHLVHRQMDHHHRHH